MFKRLVSWFILVPLTLVLVVFALANRQFVRVNFDPLSPQNPLLPSLEIPLFVVIYAVLIVGVFLGGFAAWFAQRGQRRQKRLWRRQARQLEQERKSLNEKAKRSTPSPEQNALIDAS